MTGQYASGQGFAQSPRLAMAQMLMQRGASTDPVRSPLEGIARALTGGVGGLFAGNARADQQKALADAFAALNDPSIPADQRMTKAIEAAGDSSFADQLRGIAVSKMLPKDPVKLGRSDRLVDPTTGKETVAAAPDLPQGFRLNPQSGAVEVMPGFVPAISGLKQAEAGATAQGTADVNLAMQPKIAEAMIAPEARKAGAVAQSTANVDLAMKPRIGAATVAAETPGLVSRGGQMSEATTAGANRANLASITPMGGGPQVPTTQALHQAQAAGTQGGQGGFTRENSLRDEFTKLTGDFRTVQDAKNKIDEAGKIPTPAGDLTLLYAFNKLLDPNSVVRESEFATAAATGSLGERLQAAVGRLATGERLTDEQRRDFLDQANNIYKAQKRGYDNTVTQYTGLASQYGLKPENVVTKFETGAPQASGASSLGGDSPQGLPRFADDAASRAAYAKLAPGSAYHDESGQLRFKP